jgi:hypothetical protein
LADLPLNEPYEYGRIHDFRINFKWEQTSLKKTNNNSTSSIVGPVNKNGCIILCVGNLEG